MNTPVILKGTDMDIELVSSAWRNSDKNLIPPLHFYSFDTDCPPETSCCHWYQSGRLKLDRQLWSTSPEMFNMNEHEVGQRASTGEQTFSPYLVKKDWQSRVLPAEGVSNPKGANSPSLATASSGGTQGGKHSQDNNSCPSGNVGASNSDSFKETIELLLYCCREHGVTVRSEELRNLVEVFICQVFDSLNVFNGASGSASGNDSQSTSTGAAEESRPQGGQYPISPSYSSSVKSSPHLGNISDSVQKAIQGDSLSCPVCYGVLCDPVTIPCGHSYCKKCLQKEIPGNSCRRCNHTLTSTDVSIIKSNILIGSLIEKWWPTEVSATKLRNEGNRLFEAKKVEAALAKYTQSLDVVVEDHVSLGNRSHALLTAGKSEEAYHDAEAATRCCPVWSKGYFRKSAALISLGRYEEAFLTLTVCLYLVKATSGLKEDPAVTQVMNEMMKILYKILLQSAGVGQPTKRHSNEQIQFTPYPTRSKLSQRNERRRGLNHWNDSEYNSSGDEGDHPQHFHNNLHHSQYHNAQNSSPSNLGKSTPWKSARIHDPMHIRYNHHHITSPYVHSSSPAAEQLSVKINRLFGRASQDLKSYELRLKGLKKQLREVNPTVISCSDVECSLCYRLLFQPVSTGCGHTFCRSCLDRCLDHNPACPLCKTSLQSYLAHRESAMTEFLDVAIRQFLPKEYEERLNQHLEELNAGPLHGKDLDSDVPIFVCTMAFPTIPCPLHVFEPRYRLMIRRCMENGTNRFGMCCYVAEGEHNYGEIGTLLEIRNIQYFADGRSVVDTIGRRRFRVVRKSIVDGYNSSTIELLHDRPIPESEMPAVHALHDKVFKEADEWLLSIGQVRRQRIHSHFGLMPSPDDDWKGSPDGPSWTWWLLAILPLDSKAQLSILSMCSLQKRLDCILKVLNFVKSRMNSLGE